MDMDSGPPPIYPELSSKRRLNEENEEIDDMMGGGMKKRRMPTGEDIGPKLVNLIKKLDEDLNGASIENALDILANTLEENLDPYEGQIIHILYECAAYLPEKITIFSTLVGILNSRSADFGERLLSKFIDELHHTFATEQYDISIRIITFLCDLGNSRVVSVHSIVDFLEDFVDLVAGENIKSDFFVYSVLHALPWIGPELNEKMADRLNSMLDRVAVYLGKRRKDHTKILRVWSDSEFPQEDYLDSLWAQLQKLREANWLEKHILRIYAHFGTILRGSTEHEMPSIDKELLKETKNHPLPRCVFRLFQQSDCLDNEITLPPSDAIERFLVAEDLNWIIDNNYTDWKLCARALLAYHRRETVPLNYVVIEAIFSQLFRLPNPAHLELFYGALLIELCRSQSNSMPQVLALAAEMLFQRADTMQPICLDRFVDWFSYHLSNFEYRWSWSDWAECIDLDSLHPKRIFVREVIDKCMRLCYHKKLFEFLPKEFAPIIPDEPNINYILDDDRHPAFEKAEQFKELIMRKSSDEDMLFALEIRNEDEAPVEEGEEEKPKVYSADSVAVFFAVLLKLASKTLTHSFAALTRYHKTLCTLTSNNEEMQSIILRTLYDSWSLHKQMMTILVDKMIKMRILDPAIVQAWIFSEEMKVEFKRTWVWDVLSSAVVHLERQRKKLIRDGEHASIRLKRLEAQKRSTTTIERSDRGTAEQVMEAMTTEEGGGEGANGNGEWQGSGQEEGEEEEQMKRPRIVAPKLEKAVGEQMPMDLDANGMAPPVGQEGGGEGPAQGGNIEEKMAKTSEQIAALTADLERIEDTLRMVLLNICHKFTLIITEHILNCETDGTEVTTNFYNFVTGRFKYVFLKHLESMWKFASDLDAQLFSSSTIEPRIRQIFEQFKSLRH